MTDCFTSLSNVDKDNVGKDQSTRVSNGPRNEHVQYFCRATSYGQSILKVLPQSGGQVYEKMIRSFKRFLINEALQSSCACHLDRGKAKDFVSSSAAIGTCWHFASAS